MLSNLKRAVAFTFFLFVMIGCGKNAADFEAGVQQAAPSRGASRYLHGNPGAIQQ